MDADKWLESDWGKISSVGASLQKCFNAETGFASTAPMEGGLAKPFPKKSNIGSFNATPAPAAGLLVGMEKSSLAGLKNKGFALRIWFKSGTGIDGCLRVRRRNYTKGCWKTQNFLVVYWGQYWFRWRDCCPEKRCCCERSCRRIRENGWGPPFPEGCESPSFAADKSVSS